ncbi:YjbH domain-containing protein [Autumnicola edwardsiae]|uniref:YjbH domain-containing protein n=1 Tax=Autumnicola edwardsiae TaxID=3075594 RepID=A0ABU3CVE5_9FLAO|nr:YjbH domain-containing protein [Zunongwangia sp. F297]MDT0650324.1 YjbH domain-containing protein [Zunongwangia sp. F297]
MRKIWISLCFFLLFLNGRSQEVEEVLYKAGFENVMVKSEGEDTIKVFFEHREFRSPYHSMRYAKLLLRDVQDKNIVWAPLYHNFPIGNYNAENYNYRPLTKEDKTFFKRNNSWFKGYRFHFRIHPNFAARFGFYDQPFQTKLDIILDTRLYLATGLSIQSGIRIPVQNSLDSRNSGVRLAPSLLHCFTQPVPNHFFGISLGTYYYDRYGWDLQYRYSPLDSRWSFGLESGLTGYYRIDADSYATGDLSFFHAVVDAEYRLPFENLSLKLSAGQFIFEDKGFRVDLIRQFGTVDLGLYAANTNVGTTAGFQFAFSLFPGSIYRSQNLELRTTEAFRWEYSYNNEEPVAKSYRLGIPRLSNILRQYNARFIKSLSN